MKLVVLVLAIHTIPSVDSCMAPPYRSKQAPRLILPVHHNYGITEIANKRQPSNELHIMALSITSAPAINNR
ncbi:hypothetical protein BDV39DRAFT_180764 [Aspergillus sergii]|uniref:Secreted protein n=1 Tax=Aspergillus sergii TaxID=1034303 RepID=A0A5N6WUE9_9EURO|nr:hypothetical protein BDV39DRAFT_180764 [Aspergillus sergii]